MNTIQLKSESTPRKIRFNFNALAEYETLTGGSALSLSKSLGIREVRALAYVGLKEGDASFNLDINDLGKILSLEDMDSIIKVFTKDVSGDSSEGK